MNFVDYVLITQYNCYKIEYDEEMIDKDGLFFAELTKEDILKYGNINHTYSTEILKNDTNINKINTWFNDNINTLLDDINNDEVINKKEESTICIGNHFYTLSNSCIKVKTSKIKRYLSFLGYYRYATLILIDKQYDLNFLIVPKIGSKIRNIISPCAIQYEDKEGNIKKANFYGKGSKYSVLEIESLLILNTYIQCYQEKQNYEKILIMKYKIGSATSKPITDKTTEINITNMSKMYYESCKNIIQYSRDFDVRFNTSQYILNSSYNNYVHMMSTFNKASQKINIEIGDEIMNNYNDKIKNIYNDVVVNKISIALNRLVGQDKGYMALTKLYNVRNEKSIYDTILFIATTYHRHIINKNNVNKPILLNNEEIDHITQIVNDKEDAKIIAQAIIFKGTCFYKIKKENKDMEKGE